MKGSAAPVKPSPGRTPAAVLLFPRPPLRPTTTMTVLGAGWFGSRAYGSASTASWTVCEDPGQGVAKHRKILGFRAGHEDARPLGARHDLLVDPDRARIPQIGAQAWPRGHRPSEDDVGFDESPRRVADRRDRLASGEEAPDKGDRVGVGPQLVRVGHPAGQHEPGEVSFPCLADLKVNRHPLAPVEVLEELDLVCGRRYEHGLAALREHRLPRTDQLALLGALRGREERHELGLKCVGHRVLPLPSYGPSDL